LFRKYWGKVRDAVRGGAPAGCWFPSSIPDPRCCVVVSPDPRRVAMVVYNFRSLKPVPSVTDLLDLVLSRTQRKTSTEVHKRYSIQRIRQFYMMKVALPIVGASFVLIPCPR
jgi:hypothetical protein